MVILWSAALVLAADQLTKYWIRGGFTSDRVLVVIDGVWNITYVSNRGGAFGILSQHQYLFVVLSLITIAAIVYVYHSYAPRMPVCRLAVGLILGGAVGNLLDRLLFDPWGGVTDWLDFHWGAYHWPAFNIADSAITIGVFALLYLLLMKMPVEGPGGA
ncbi:MAG: signal peptidase II [Candidatus Aureabacteria bacterium]|nr:signal peptidase II [Candidatus Auribacterota bacterium]